VQRLPRPLQGGPAKRLLPVQTNLSAGVSQTAAADHSSLIFHDLARLFPIRSQARVHHECTIAGQCCFPLLFHKLLLARTFSIQLDSVRAARQPFRSVTCTMEN
jgi:hypothetical protein